MSSEDYTNICFKIRSWLTQEELFREMVKEDGLRFHIAAEYPAKSGRHVSVLQPMNRNDMIVVFSRIRLADAHKLAIRAMPAGDQERLIWKLRYDLLFQESSFELELNQGYLDGIHFTRDIYYDGLTKNRLLEAIRENFKCELYVVWKFQEVFGDGLTGKTSSPPEPMYR